MDFKDTSELLDQLIFNHLSDSFAGASNEFPRPKFTTRPTPSWISRPRRTTTTPRSTSKDNFNYGMHFAMPALEESNIDKPHHTATRSTSTYGGVASNTGIII